MIPFHHREADRIRYHRQAIILVGGFGGNAYLKEVLEKANPGIRVIQPKDA